MATEEVRAHCLFHGRVQGVCFRAYTVEFARGLGVKGWVKNLHDGSVEAVFQGEKEKVDAAIRMCREEQPHGKVSSVDTSWEEPDAECEGYSIRY
jgi:acylphosphatase